MFVRYVLLCPQLEDVSILSTFRSSVKTAGHIFVIVCSCPLNPYIDNFGMNYAKCVMPNVTNTLENIDF